MLTWYLGDDLLPQVHVIVDLRAAYNNNNFLHLYQLIKTEQGTCLLCCSGSASLSGGLHMPTVNHWMGCKNMVLSDMLAPLFLDSSCLLYAARIVPEQMLDALS